MQDFLKFNKMITPAIISVIFYVGSVISIIGGLITIISGTNSYYGGGVQVITGLLFILIGPFVIRIYCELLIVMFKMHESLQVITKNVTQENNPAPSSKELI